MPTRTRFVLTIGVAVQGPRDHAAAAAELLFDSVSNPAIMDHMLDAQKEKISTANDQLVKDPAFMASEGVVSVAYSGALARPSFWQGQPISSEHLLAYHGAVSSPCPLHVYIFHEEQLLCLLSTMYPRTGQRAEAVLRCCNRTSF